MRVTRHNLQMRPRPKLLPRLSHLRKHQHRQETRRDEIRLQRRLPPVLAESELLHIDPGILDEDVYALELGGGAGCEGADGGGGGEVDGPDEDAGGGDGGVGGEEGLFGLFAFGEGADGDDELGAVEGEEV